MSNDIVVGDPRIVTIDPDEDIKDGYYRVMHDRWWLADSSGRVMLWQTDKKRRGKTLGASPLCNKNKSITERFKVTYEAYDPECYIKQVPRVFVPIAVNDYSM